MTTRANTQVDYYDAVGVVKLIGEVDIVAAQDLRDRLLSAVRNEDLGLVVDLTETSYIDSVGVSLLFELAERAAAAHGGGPPRGRPRGPGARDRERCVRRRGPPVGRGSGHLHPRRVTAATPAPASATPRSGRSQGSMPPSSASSTGAALRSGTAFGLNSPACPSIGLPTGNAT